jgi:hypothetical protein
LKELPGSGEKALRVQRGLKWIELCQMEFVLLKPLPCRHQLYFFTLMTQAVFLVKGLSKIKVSEGVFLADSIEK